MTYLGYDELDVTAPEYKAPEVQPVSPAKGKKETPKKDSAKKETSPSKK